MLNDLVKNITTLQSSVLPLLSGVYKTLFRFVVADSNKNNLKHKLEMSFYSLI